MNSSSSSTSNQSHSLKFIEPQDHLNHYPISSQSDLNPTSSGHRISYLLLELPPVLLNPIKEQLNNPSNQNQNQLELRGRLEDDLVLTTKDKTYSLRTIQNSNSVMICKTIPDSININLSSLEVLQTVNETIEIFDVTSFPGTRLERIKELLQPWSYSGEDEEEKRMGYMNDDDHSIEPITFQSLSNETRASDEEIKQFLSVLNVIKLKDSLRILNLSYLAEILKEIIDSSLELGFKLDEPFMIEPLVEIVSVKMNISTSVLLQVLSWYDTRQASTTETPQDLSLDSKTTISFDINKIVTVIGLSLLLSIKPTQVEPMNPRNNKTIQTTPIESFLTDWKTRIGEPYSDQYCSIDSLKTHSIISSDQKNLIIVPIEKLSSEPKTRMSQLFEIRNKWKMEELERFVKPITGGGVKKQMDELVLKYCRKIREKESIKVLDASLTKEFKMETVDVVWLTARNNW
ncbi:uncharacterized protein MELLADRAFT_61341 [Melampsora larici-populina 98AG31]|uniref:Sister chromatid cohesion protein DCC1 n=1 Tax=Melampsora larici-populina (strain 98AG31 / pathotype 3-4-7) TaxID=747676 RepID=F4REI1_MELLP|nr:uncharacterized protein MELLADRAFT_61341 [Melampsora larici-populina 98AG31]EGG09095.1 hypothetical protein MELLADRAFT_61341 [Melampsora larici-populina 98AG31]